MKEEAFKPTPPRWAEKFLEWYCHPSLLEEIQGDAQELFSREVVRGRRRARALYAWNVLRFFRWRNIRRDRFQANSILTSDMFRSYLLTGFRSLLRNATPSLINLIGLSVAIGCAVMVFIIEDSYYNLDAMHEKGDRIGLVVNHMQEGDETQKDARSSPLLAQLLQQHTAVEHAVRAARSVAALRVGEKVFTERGLFVDDQFLSLFSFRLMGGTRSALREKDAIILSVSMAKKYFADDDPVGRAVSLKFPNGSRKELVVRAVLEDTPGNSSMYFDYLLPFALWEDLNPNLKDNWGPNATVTFALFRDGQGAEQLNNTFDQYRAYQHQTPARRKIVKSEILKLPDVARESYQIAGSLSWSNAPAAMVAFAVIAIFLILLACFNYINVAVASVSTRLKEIGIRKVIGGRKSEIIQQFLTENLLLCCLSLVVGTGLAYFLLVPAFDSLYPVKVPFEISSFRMAVIFFGGLLLFVAFVSGAYPAIYVASFNTVKILRGKERFGSKSLFSRILLTAQFTLSITTVVACLVFVWSSYYFEKKDWGYDARGIVFARLTDPAQFESLRKTFADDKDVVAITGALHHIGKSSEQIVFQVEEKSYKATRMTGGIGYLEAMNIRLKSGRFFQDVSSDKAESVIVNEAFVRKMGWSSPLQQTFELDSVKRYVVGVVEDFYYDDFYWAIEPTVFTLTDARDYQYFVLKCDAGAADVAEERLRKAWTAVAPDDPFEGSLQAQVFDRFHDSNRANNKVIYFISGVAVLLVAMGLYGLVSYNLTRRLREFSVRKVFGADLPHIFQLMNRDYIWIVIIAFAIGAPAGSYLMDLMLNAVYPEKIPTTYWPYAIAISVMVTTVAATVASQLRRVAQENPVQTLRLE